MLLIVAKIAEQDPTKRGILFALTWPISVFYIYYISRSEYNSRDGHWRAVSYMQCENPEDPCTFETKWSAGSFFKINSLKTLRNIKWNDNKETFEFQ